MLKMKGKDVSLFIIDSLQYVEKVVNFIDQIFISPLWLRIEAEVKRKL